MLKVTMIYDDSYSQVAVSSSDSLYEILVHRNISPEQNNIYLNGSQIPRQKYVLPISSFPKTGNTIFMTIKPKTVY